MAASCPCAKPGTFIILLATLLDSGDSKQKYGGGRGRCHRYWQSKVVKGTHSNYTIALIPVLMKERNDVIMSNADIIPVLTPSNPTVNIFTVLSYLNNFYIQPTQCMCLL
jgi:hypothetical protein